MFGDQLWILFFVFVACLLYQMNEMILAMTVDRFQPNQHVPIIACY